MALGAALANCTSLECFVPELQAFRVLQQPPGIGQQNFTYGCLLALSESLQVQDGALAFTDQDLNCFFNNPPVCDNDTLANVQNAAIYGQLCGTDASAPEVVVPHSWCAANLSGWQRSNSTPLSQWIGPVVQFILPCLAFCLSIPRSWKFAVPNVVFASRTGKLDGAVGFAWKLPLALIIVTLDTIFWLSMCFAFAGPMLLSAVYEFTLDRKIIDYLSATNLSLKVLPLNAVPTFVLCTLVGNIRFDTPKPPPATAHNTNSTQVQGPGSALPGAQPNGAATPVNPSASSNTTQAAADTWKHIMKIATEFQSSSHKRTIRKIRHLAKTQAADIQEHDDLMLVEDLLTQAVRPEEKLKALLNAQSSFGGAVGAPVIFFIGGFIYNVLDARSSPGDQDTALSLAFGMWWMVIPHTAVIACAMLASNNPSTLQGMIGRIRDLRQLKHTSTGLSVTGPAATWGQVVDRYFAPVIRQDVAKWVSGMIENAYDSEFEPVTLWRRGPNKRRWIKKAIKMFEDPGVRGQWAPTAGAPGQVLDDALLEDIKKNFKLSLGDWIFMVAVLLCVLLGVPFASAFATSFLTPQRGLSCRSLTHLTYFCAQIVQMLIWYPIYCVDHREQRWKTSRGFIMLVTCRLLQFVAGSVAVFAAVGGTLLQIVGVYNNCKCKVNVPYWAELDSPQALVSLSSITQAGVDSAKYWIGFGAAVASILAIVTAFAWWHQRRLRRKIVDLLESWKKKKERMEQELAAMQPVAGLTAPAN